MFISLTLYSFRHDTSEPYYHGLTGLIYFNFVSFAGKIKCLDSLGMLCFRMDKNDKAVEFLEDALEQARKFYRGKPHLILVDVIISLGMVLRSAQNVDYERCLQYFQEAKKYMYEILGPNHAHTVTSNIFQIMAAIFYELDDLAMSQQYLQAALNMNFAICGEGSVNDAMVTVYSYLGVVSEKIGNLNEAKKYYVEGAKIMNKLVSLGKKVDFIDLLLNLLKLSLVCEALGQEDEALKLLQEAIEIEKAVGSENLQTLDVMLKQFKIASFAKLYNCLQAARQTAKEDCPPELLKYLKALKQIE